MIKFTKPTRKLLYNYKLYSQNRTHFMCNYLKQLYRELKTLQTIQLKLYLDTLQITHIFNYYKIHINGVILMSLIIFIMFFKRDGGASFHVLPHLLSQLLFSHDVHGRQNHQIPQRQPPQSPLLSYTCEHALGLSWPRAIINQNQLQIQFYYYVIGFCNVLDTMHVAYDEHYQLY